jgi:Na+/melibiose symporter-like transporter
VLVTLAGLAFSRYRLDRASHAAIRHALDERRAALSAR